MKATCPVCGGYGPLESFLVDDDAKRAVVAVGKLPGDLPRLCWAYLGMFRKPASPRVLTWERVGRIVAELADLVAEKDMSWKGQRVVPSRPEFWAQGIQAMLDRDAQGKLERPLDGHNYLRAVVYEIAEKAWHQGNVKRENEAKFRPQEPQQRRRDPEHDDKPIVPLSEGIKGWRERLGVSKNEGGDNGDSNR
jgi:hypothetical protein